MKNEKRVVKSVPSTPISTKAAAKPKKAAPPPPKKVASPAALPSVRLELYAPQARQVFIAGSFNGWEPDETAMYAAGPGKWARELALPPGKHEYLFLVDGQWLPDPKAKQFTPNPFGGQNSLIEIRPR